ncbi:MAG: zinc ribbon domain-containing protein [Actinomycetota bacterium]
MGATAHLLELQRLDTAIDRLRSRIATLSAGSELAAAVRDADAAEAQLGEIKLQLDALDRDTSRLEHDVDSLRQKAVAEEQRMASGAVANARELEAISHEVTNLRRRIADREDEELAIMERRETLAAAEKDAGETATNLREAADRLRAAAGDELTTAEADLAAREAERPAALAAVDPETLELYEELRPLKKGVAAAALVDGVCQGCHEQLSSVELSHVRSTDIPRCEHCRRILVL